MSFQCRGCSSPLTVPQGVDLRTFRCPYCGTVAPLPPMHGNMPPHGQAPPPGFGSPPPPGFGGPPPPGYGSPPPYGNVPQPMYGTREMYTGPPAARQNAPSRFGREAWKRQFSRKFGRLVPIVLLLVLPPSFCVLLMCGGGVYLAYNQMRYSALNEHLDEYVRIGDLRPETAFRSGAGRGYIRGKYVLIDIDKKQIHSWHDGDDPRLAWRPEEVQTVIWIQTRKIAAGRYESENPGQRRSFAFPDVAYVEEISVAVIDLGEQRVTGSFKLTAQPKEYVRDNESRTARVDKGEVLVRIQDLPGPPRR